MKLANKYSKEFIYYCVYLACTLVMAETQAGVRHGNEKVREGICLHLC